MGNVKQKKSAQRLKRKQRHKRSILLVISALFLLIGVLSVNSMALQAKNRDYENQKAELEKLIAEEDQRTEDIEEFEKYVKTDEYIEDRAKEKLGLAHPNEILFKAEK